MTGRERIAEPYAQALVGLLEGADALEAAADAVRAVAQRAVPDDEARLFWLSRRAGRDKQRRFLRDLLEAVQAPDAARSLLEVMFAKGRIAVLPELARVLDAKVAERLGRIVARVETARPLSETQQRALRKRFGAMTGKEVRLRTEVREDLIGGVRARLENRVIDGSVRGRLDAFAARFE